MLRFLLLAAFVGAFTACLDNTPPPTAPESLDGNMRWWFANQLSAGDADLVDGAQKLAVAGKAETRTGALKSQMARLEPADLASVGLEGVNDPAAARGFLIVNLYDCTLEKLAPILVSTAQATLYDGVYDAYERTYTSDLGAWEAGGPARLSWDVTAKASLPIADTYTSHLQGGIRRIPAAAPGQGGDVLVTRTWLPAAAEFVDPASTSYFRQDYQVEVYWEQAPGRLFHAYGMWRELKVGGFNLTTENDGMFNLLIDNLLKWDTKTAELCARP